MSEGTRVDPVRFIARRVMPCAIIILLLGRSLAYACVRLSNPDTYFHLRFGHQFLTGRWSLWHPGQVSTFGTAHWVPTQWLTEVVMAAFESVFGLAGVAWFSGLLYVALILTWYLVARRHAEPIVAALVTALAYIASFGFLSMRPQVLSFIAVAVTTEAWLRARNTGRRPWWLIGLTWVWAMCHGMWPVGLAIGLAAALGICLEHGLRAGARQLLVPLLSAVACALTPVGPRLYPAVLLVNSRSKYFGEWGPENFRSITGAAMLVLLATTIWFSMRRRLPATEALLVLVALAAALYSQRTVPVAASMLASLACVAITGASSSPLRLPPWRFDRHLVIAAGVIGLAIIAAVVPFTARQPMKEPAWLDPTMASLPPGTTVLNDEPLGAYLMWAHPNVNIISNGYGDVYTNAELSRISRMSSMGRGWISELKRTGARYAVEEKRTGLAYTLEHLGWRVVHDQGKYVFLTAPPGWLDNPGTVSP